MKKIKDISEFEKLFKIHIPKHGEFEYYINMLSKSAEYKDIYALVERFCDFEDWVEAKGTNIADYKLGYAFHRVLEYIKNSEAYKLLNTEENIYANTKFETKDELIKRSEDSYFISLDIASANYSVVKMFNEPLEQDEMGRTWEDLLLYLDVHPVIAESKSFRQLVFGNLNNKRLQKTQHNYIMGLKNALLNPESEYFSNYVELAFLAHDELILSAKNLFVAGFIANYISTMLLTIKRYASLPDLPRHISLFKMGKTDNKRIFVKRFLDMSKEINNFDGANVLYESLHGCPGSKFYMYFKKYILHEYKFDDRDLYFWNEGQLAKWVI